MEIFKKHLNGVVLLGLLLPLATFFYFAPVNAIPTCPTQLTADTMLKADCTGTIYLAKNGVTLNCASHTVSGPSTEPYGVEVTELLHVTVEKCTITGFTDGLYVAGTNSSTFEDNTATGNSNDGVLVTVNNTVTGCASGCSSISNTFSGNVANSNSEGFYFYYSYGNTVKSNTATLNSFGFDFEYSYGNTVKSNTATSNTNSGFYIDESNGVTLTSNTATSNEYGFYIYEAYGNTLTSNTANSNTNYGFLIAHGSNGNTLTNNIANSNTNSGFEATSSATYNVLSGNSAKSNTHDGFFFGSTTGGNWVVGNTASGNHHYDAEQATGATNLFVADRFTTASGI